MFDWRQTPFNLVLFVRSFWSLFLYLFYAYKGSGVFSSIYCHFESMWSAHKYLCSESWIKYFFTFFTFRHNMRSIYLRVSFSTGFRCEAKTVSGTLCRTPFSIYSLSFTLTRSLHDKIENKMAKWTKLKIDWFGKHTCRIPCV